MSRYPAQRDPVSSRASDHVDASMFVKAFEEILGTLHPWEQDMIRMLLAGIRIEEIARSYDIGMEETQISLAYVLERLRRRWRSAPLHELVMEDDFGRIMRRFSIDSQHRPDELVWCELHERWAIAATRACLVCECTVDGTPLERVRETSGGKLSLRRIGRPPLYCSAACKQRGYRLRGKRGDNPGGVGGRMISDAD